MIYKFNTNFVPAPTVPNIFKVRGKKWISFGDDNLYPQYVTELYNKSAINRTAITSKALNVVGEGLECKVEDYNYVLNRANKYESWNEVFDKASLDYETYGGFALQIIWTKDAEKIHSFYHVPFGDVRAGEIDRAEDRSKFYYYSSDWKNYKKHKPIAYHTFDPEMAEEFPNQILYFYDYAPGSKYYPLPSYSGSCSDIEIDIQVSTLHLSNLENGLNPSLWINFKNGVPDPDMQQQLYQEMASAFSGVENVGKFFATFSDSAETSPDVTPIESANDDYYVNLETRITSRILTGHRITSPLLLGLYHEGGGGLGSNKDEIIVAHQHFTRTVIQPDQQVMLKAFNRIMHYYGYNTELKIQPLNLFPDQVIGETDAIQ